MKKEKTDYKKAGFVITVIMILIAFIAIRTTVTLKEIEEKDDYKEEWRLVATVTSDALGEHDPGDEGWLSAFHLDYGQVPETVLANNATDWSTDPNARGYVDTDNTETDLKSEDPSYFVFRCKFDNDSMDAGEWNYSRFRVNLTVSGDETISDVGEYDNSSTAGDATISAHGPTHIFINFWWDDGIDGYRITDDGSLPWSISIYERY